MDCLQYRFGCRVTGGLLLALGAASTGLAATNLIVNGTFDTNTPPWLVSEAVPVTGASAVLTDTSGDMPSLHQSVSLPASILGYTIGFDYLNALSSGVAPGKLRDTFFATLYFGDAAFGVTLPGTFTASVDLVDLDSTGASNFPAGALFQPSPRGPGWTRYQFSAAPPAGFSAGGFATVAFQFFELNGLAADSTVAIDNVFLTVITVPEPGIAPLLGSAFLLLRRRRSSSFLPA